MDRLDREPDRLEPTRLVARPGSGQPWRYALAGSAVTALIASGALYGMMRYLPRARAAAPATQDVCAKTPIAVAPPPPAAPPAPAPPPASAAAPPPVAASAAVAPGASASAPIGEAEPAPSGRPRTRARGTLTVVCQPQCDSIVDNGKWIGNGSVVNKPVVAGRHALVLTANGVRKTVIAEVQPDASREVHVVMEDGVKGPLPESTF